MSLENSIVLDLPFEQMDDFVDRLADNAYSEVYELTRKCIHMYLEYSTVQILLV